jgi:hypothetical protein
MSDTRDMQGWIDVLERYGRHGDTLLAHITPSEAKHLQARGGAGTRNPVTGLLEFWGGDDSGDDGGGMSGSEGSDSVGGGYGGGSDVGNDTNPGGDNDGGGGLGGGWGPGGFFSQGEDLSKESEIGQYGNGYVNWTEYERPDLAPKNTFDRFRQEVRQPSVPQSRLSMPTGMAPGILGPMVGLLGGPVMAGLMAIGGAMGRAGGVTVGPDAKNSGGNETSAYQTGLGRRDPGPGASEGMASQPAAAASTTAPPPPRLTPESWDEGGFLNRNPEVRAAVDNGTWSSGYDFNNAYQSHAGVPYEQAMSFAQPDKYAEGSYVEDLLATKQGAVMPYKGY